MTVSERLNSAGDMIKMLYDFFFVCCVDRAF